RQIRITTHEPSHDRVDVRRVLRPQLSQCSLIAVDGAPNESVIRFHPGCLIGHRCVKFGCRTGVGHRLPKREMRSNRPTDDAVLPQADEPAPPLRLSPPTSPAVTNWHVFRLANWMQPHILK